MTPLGAPSAQDGPVIDRTADGATTTAASLANRRRSVRKHASASGPARVLAAITAALATVSVIASVVVVLTVTAPTTPALANPTSTTTAESQPVAAASASTQPSDSSARQEALDEAFRQLLRNAVLEGAFTISGQPLEKASVEKYTILGVNRSPQFGPSRWTIRARIEYGGKDRTVPVLVDVFWADQTPVITLTDTTIPGMGTFSARVLFHEGSYAGTWSARTEQQRVGGQMFGLVKRLDPTPAPDSNR